MVEVVVRQSRDLILESFSLRVPRSSCQHTINPNPAALRDSESYGRSSRGKQRKLLIGHQTRYAERAADVRPVRHTMHLIKLLLYVYLVLKAPKDPSEKETDMYDKKLLRKGVGEIVKSHVSFDAIIVHMRCGKMRFGSSIDGAGGGDCDVTLLIDFRGVILGQRSYIISDLF